MSDDNWLSNLLYEEKPFLLILIGTIALLVFDGQVGEFSGLLFILAGVLVAKLRLSHRGRELERRRKRGSIARGRT
ncbi:hypothetical protein [Marinobacterium arenosum]|uniref:hypothetical protein n=1 Tax=Marinobacterium arenosum TaxID=2862496 RepID=UPI001C978711|nr:hypothetical protein [Marinobacterium arenosum]MBY4677522.1 hypothetical protein [Marinobacterium arenosum]